MKRSIFSVLACILAVAAWAQNIAVVSPGNETKLYRTLGEAIYGAKDGSVIYLPGGGFTIPDTVKINKRLTIMGVSHRGTVDNADGATIISGNLFFEEGSSSSALMGVYLTGNLNIGSDGSAVRDFVLRYCNVNSVKVNNSLCTDITVNQNYIRKYSQFGNSNPKITNNILGPLSYIVGGDISNNIFTDKTYSSGSLFFRIADSSITNNIIVYGGSYGIVEYCETLFTSRNMLFGEWGDECINLPDGTTWDDVFKDPNPGVSIRSNFEFEDAYKKYSDVGIYGGTGFNDDQLAPIPRIVSKKVAERTDGSGKLKIEVTVKAN